MAATTTAASDAPAEPGSLTSRNPQLEGLRAVAALAVLVALPVGVEALRYVVDWLLFPVIFFEIARRQNWVGNKSFRRSDRKQTKLFHTCRLARR